MSFANLTTLRLCCVLFGSLLTASAQAQVPSMTVYSDICMHEETGDLLGTRVALLKLPDATYVFFQLAEGELSPPVIGKLLQRGETIAFEVDLYGKTLKFIGTLTNTAITARLSNNGLSPSGSEVFRLPRIRDTTASIPRCR